MARLRHVIVQVPGIGGSVLSDAAGRPVWDVSARRIGYAVVRPGTLRLDAHPDLVPDRLIDTTTVIPPVLVMPGYDGMVHHLRTQFGAGLTVTDYRPGRPVPAATEVLRVPYDFRKSVRDAAELLDRAVHALFDGAAPGGAAPGEGRTVIVLAHSMGGLVARYWVGCLAGWRYCHALITLGTPHRGAPRALDWLVNGAGLGRWRYPPATRVLRGWPSVYELLPQYPAVWQENGPPLEPVELAGSCVRAFGEQDAPGRVLRMAREAAGVHADIAAGWAAIPDGSRPKVVPYFGRGHATPNLARLLDGRVAVTKDDPQWRGNVGWRGDGTVPAVSAIPADLTDREEVWRAVPDKHGPMGSTPAPMDLLTTLVGDKLPGRGQLRPDRPWIGLDIDDVVASGAEIQLGAELLAGGAGGVTTSGTGGTARLVPSGQAGGTTPDAPLVADGTGWRATLPPSPPGLYEVHVEIKGGWYGTSVFASAPLAVVEPAFDEAADGEPASGEAEQ
jgi:hypothetical protein